MPAWITIFCRKPADGITAELITQGIRDADFFTLAEDYDIDPSRVEAALSTLRIEPFENAGFQIAYQEPAARPIVVHRWAHPERVAGELAEANERLAAEPEAMAAAVQARLHRVNTVIGIELGFSQLEDMGIVIAAEVTRWLASVLGGLIETVDHRWWTIGRWGEYQPLEPEA